MITTAWLVSFQQQVEQMGRCCQAFVDQYETIDDMSEEAHKLEDLRHSMRITTLWAEALPLDDLLWSYVEEGHVFRAIVGEFDLVSEYFEALHSLRNRRLDGADAREAAQRLDEAIKAVHKTLDEVRRRPSTRPASRLANDFEVRLPFLIVGEFCLYEYPRYIAQPAGAFDLSDWPPVVYHTHIEWLLAQIVEILVHFAHDCQNLALNRTATHFEIAILNPAGPLLPATWQRLMDEEARTIELLRMMGGGIEPSTWNEGLGEGMIVRLPWAPSQGTKDGD